MPDTILSPVASPTPTVASLASRVLQQLQDIPLLDENTNNITASGTSATVAATATDRYEFHDIIEWDADGDLALVTAIAATTLTLQRGILGVTATAHDGSVTPTQFRKWPRFFRRNIERAINDTLENDLQSIWAVYETQITYTPTTAEMYEVDATYERLYDAYQKSTSTPTRLLPVLLTDPFLTDATLAPTHKRMTRVVAASTTGTIFARFIRRPRIGDLSSPAVQVVTYGATARLLAWSNAESTGKVRRRSPTVTAGSELQSSSYFFALRDEARASAIAEFANQYPNMQNLRRYVPPAWHLP